MNNEKLLRRKVQVNLTIKVLLIFLGILLMQLVAYMICVFGYALKLQFQQGMGVLEVLDHMTEYMTNPQSSLMIQVSIVSATLCLVWCLVLYRKSSWREENFAYGKAFGGTTIPWIVGTSMSACVIVVVVMSILQTYLPQLFTKYLQAMSQLTESNSLIVWGYVLLIGPASEEIIFRGAVMDRLKLAYPFWLANVLQAALFGLYHMNLMQGMYAFLLGMLLGLIREVVGSIFANIMAHVAFNLTNNILAFFFSGNHTWESVVLILLAFLCFGVVVLGMRYFLSRSRQQKVESRA